MRSTQSAHGIQRRKPLLFGEPEDSPELVFERLDGTFSVERQRFSTRGNHVCTDIKETIGQKQADQCGKKMKG